AASAQAWRAGARAGPPTRIIARQAATDRGRTSSAPPGPAARSVVSPIEPADEARAGKVGIGSDRSFGFVMAAFFVLVACLPLLRGGDARPGALPLAGAFAAGAVARPRLLHPLNQAWFRLGLLLHRLVSPLILAVLFFIAVTP